ncbi:MAG: rhomboid family intramembrane serine protease [Leptospiraceae bacterium]|nr:rhomboid family intramembrane serine protease [Leptospiraceae bacterium]
MPFDHSKIPVVADRGDSQETTEHGTRYDGGGSLRLAFSIVLLELVIHIFADARLLPDFIHGVLPRTASGALGILFAPFLHANWEHLFSNSVPLFLSIWGVSYLYRPVRWTVLITGMLMPGLGVWFWDDAHVHLGASGWIYALLAFLFWSGIIRRNPRPIALSLIIVFLYGGMIWRVLPLEEGISWQSHLMGAVAGFLLSLIFYRIPVPDPLAPEPMSDDAEAALTDEHDEHDAINAIDAIEADFEKSPEQIPDWPWQQDHRHRNRRS